MTIDEFKLISPSLPLEPGVYKYYNNDNNIIYVGKAKNLKHRIESYFYNKQQTFKTKYLVQNIFRIEFIIVNSEHDALLLENTLIKKHKPRYNINLKDDKSFPYLVIKNEPFSRVFFSRHKEKDGSLYLGPYTSVFLVRDFLKLIRQFFPFRTCHLNLSDYAIEQKKYKVCLQYHIKKCMAPCVGLQSESEYNTYINEVKKIASGKTTELAKEIEKDMLAYAQELNFEKAQVLKEKLELIKQFQQNTIIEIDTPIDVDVFTISLEENLAFVNYMLVRQGKIIDTQTIELKTVLDDSIEDVLIFAITHIRVELQSTSDFILSSLNVHLSPQLYVKTPEEVYEKQLLQLSLKNLYYYKQEVNKLKYIWDDDNLGKNDFVLLEMKNVLHLSAMPYHIECFDNSNFQGTNPVSAVVCFKYGVPSRNDYRHYHVKNVEGINDFETMKQAVKKRYSGLLQKQQPLPNLVIIDGGKGQLNCAYEAMQELNIHHQITTVGLAKNQEEIFFVGDKESIRLDMNSPAMKLIINIRNEVHRFGITFHRKTRSKNALVTELEHIEGIGPHTIKKLLSTFYSVNNIKQASLQELTNVIGESKANLVMAYFSSKETFFKEQ